MTAMSVKPGENRAYWIGVASAALTAFLTVWSTIVRDDGSGLPFFMVVLAAPVAAFAASFRAGGMARGMAGVAAMQALLAIGIVTAPDGTPKAVLAGATLPLLWLISAGFFQAAARAER